jgi:hypothetical protein
MLLETTGQKMSRRCLARLSTASYILELCEYPIHKYGDDIGSSLESRSRSSGTT